MSSESNYIEKTVEFKAISGYDKNVNILNKLGYENSPEYKELINYLKQFKLGKDDKSIKANVTSPNGRFLISDDEKAASFFSLLYQCHSKNIALHFREMQVTDYDNKVGSGMMLDFDIYQKSNKNPLEQKSCENFATSVMECIANMLEWEQYGELETYIGIIQKPRLVFNTEKNKWKNGFHMLIPNIWLSREQKKMVLQEILNNKACNEEFMKVFEINLASALDMQCASVPVYFLNNCKEDVTEPYFLSNVLTFKIVDRDGRTGTKTSNDFISGSYPSTINRELSLSFKGVEKTKKFYDFKPAYSQKLIKNVEVNKKFDDEMDESINIFNHFNSYVDDNLEYYRNLVMEVLDPKRAEDRQMWRDVVFALANINRPYNKAFKEIARQFSMRCPSKYDRQSFEDLWSQAISKDISSKITYNSIIYWCREDNLDKFSAVLDKDIKTIIESDAFTRDNRVLTGSLYQYHFAYYVYHLFKQKFAYDISGKDGMWYEFVLEGDEAKTGEIYKWRHEVKPDSLIIYISNRLPEIVSCVLEKAEIRKSKVTDESIVKYIESRSDNLRKSGEKLYMTEFKKGIIKEAESLFRRRGFIDSLDEGCDTMGVANGVLVLGEEVKFVTGYHEHLVSMYTKINYRPFDINSEEARILLKVIIGIFPEDEMDMFHYLMYFLSTSLDNMPKDSIFLILQGSGSNGKSSLLELASTVLGMYGTKVNIAILTEKRNSSSSANEQMMKFKRARLAFYSESNKQEEFNTAVMKEFTSQESVTGRGIFEKQQTFRPKCNHVITTNFYPVIKTTDYGIWRRMKLYKFKMSFKPKHLVDPTNKYEREEDETVAKQFSYNEKIKEAFLALLVEYYKDLKKNHGGKMSNIYCNSLEKDSLEYRNSMDTLNRFICSNIVISKDSKINISEIVESYMTFLTEEYGKNNSMQKNEVKQLVENSQLKQYSVNNASGRIDFHGIRLLDLEDEDERLLEGECMFIDTISPTSKEDTNTYHSESKTDPLGLNEWRKMYLN